MMDEEDRYWKRELKKQARHERSIFLLAAVQLLAAFVMWWTN